MNKEFSFFTYLLESYARYKNMPACEVLKLWDELNITDYIFNSYEMYHMEALENAFCDIDSLILENKHT